MLADYRARNPEAAAAAALEQNRANVPETHARRPLTGAALAAVNAKESRRIHRLLEEQWERSTYVAMAAAEDAQCAAMPGMWAGC